MAPIANRIPISRVRSVTDTSMMFMMPIPPTNSASAAVVPNNHVKIWLAFNWSADHFLGAANVEVIRFVGMEVMTFAKQSHRPAGRDWDRGPGGGGDEYVVQPGCAPDPLHRSGVGYGDEIVLVPTAGRRSFGLNMPMTRQGIACTRMLLPTGSSFANRF